MKTPTAHTHGTRYTLTGCISPRRRHALPVGYIPIAAPGWIIVAASGQANAEMMENLAPTLTIHHEQPYMCTAFMAGQAKNARSIAYNEDVSPTLKGSPSGLNQIPCVCEPTVYGICSDPSNSMMSANPRSGVYVAETCRTLDQNCGNPVCNQGGVVVVEPMIARTLTARGDSSPCADRGQNIIVFAQNQRNELRDLHGVAGCLRLLNLFANPNYAHLEDDDVTPAIPFISEKGGANRNEAV